MIEPDRAAGPQDLAELLEYQEGAVVSRAIVKRRSGTVTVFAFDKGEELSEHTAPFDALIYVIDGRAEIYVAGKKHVVEAGQMIVLPADRPHAVKAPTRFKMVLTMIRS